MAQIPNMNWMGNQPSGSAYDVYQYYLGGGGPGSTQSGGGGGITSLPWYQQTGGGGGGGFNLPRNYYKAPITAGYGEGMVDPSLAKHLPAYLAQSKPPNAFLKGIGGLLKTGLSAVSGIPGIGWGLDQFKMDPAHASNQRWAVDDAGFGTGSQRDQFGMLVGQSFADPDRTYEDRLDEKEEELEKFFARGKKNSTFKKQLEHIKQVKKIQKAERVKKQQEIAKQTRPAIERSWGDPSSGDYGNPGGTSGAMTDENVGTYCFDPNTLVQMADGSEKKIKDIQLGDNTKGGEVTGVFQFKAGDEIHDYKGVKVAGSHYVKEDGKFIMVQDSPLSIKIDPIPVVYSLDTTGRRIFINDIEFADYNGDGITKSFLSNAGVNLPSFNKEVLRQVEQRLI